MGDWQVFFNGDTVEVVRGVDLTVNEGEVLGWARLRSSADPDEPTVRLLDHLSVHGSWGGRPVLAPWATVRLVPLARLNAQVPTRQTPGGDVGVEFRVEHADVDPRARTIKRPAHLVHVQVGLGTRSHARYVRTMGKLDLDAAAAFLETIPAGHWASYGDVAVAGGRGANAAQGVVSWISARGHELANVHRVLNSSGEVNTGWRPAGPGLPADAGAVRRLLEAEGLRFVSGRADPSRRRRP